MNMKKTIRRTAHVLLILPLLAAGFPYFCPEDAGRDHGVDLEDAILHARNVADSAVRPGQFASSVKKAISAFHVVAELDEQIMPSKDAAPAQPDITFLVSLGIRAAAPCDTINVVDRHSDFKTEAPQPDTPPPRACMIVSIGCHV